MLAGGGSFSGRTHHFIDGSVLMEVHAFHGIQILKVTSLQKFIVEDKTQKVQMQVFFLI